MASREFDESLPAAEKEWVGADEQCTRAFECERRERPLLTIIMMDGHQVSVLRQSMLTAPVLGAQIMCRV
jgi:hypothetical protein